jgi:uncharacterized metal-binding protein
MILYAELRTNMEDVIMTESCCATEGNVMILPCSGGSNVGQLANQAAVELTQDGFGKIFCLAGIGGRLSAFVQSAKDVEHMIVIDGCEIACGKATLETAGVPMKDHLLVTDLGIAKNKNFSLSKDDLDMIKDAVKNICRRSMLSPEGLPMAGGCGCSCGS